MCKKGKQWCAVPGCMNMDKNDKRHFFRFPKEHDRWLKWIKASKRMDLKLKGPDYAYRNCTICHFHFEEKWLIRKMVMRLHPDAIPTIFFGPAFNRDDMQCAENQPIDVDEKCISINNMDAIHSNNMDVDNSNAKTEQSTSRSTQKTKKPMDAIHSNNMDVDNSNAEAEQSTSRITQRTKKSSDKSPREEKLLKQVVKLRQRNNKLRQVVRRLRLKQEKKKTTKKEDDVKN